jgi:Protein of unknown function (DUF3168)
MSAVLALQKAIRARLVATTGVTSLVPAASILDRNARPAPDPSIILGEDQATQDSGLSRDKQRLYSTIHIWKKELSTAGAKAIAGEIRTAINSSRLQLEAGFHCADCFVADMRFLRDPDGETSHGIITLESIVGTQ